MYWIIWNGRCHKNRLYRGFSLPGCLFCAIRRFQARVTTFVAGSRKHLMKDWFGKLKIYPGIKSRMMASEMNLPRSDSFKWLFSITSWPLFKYALPA